MSFLGIRIPAWLGGRTRAETTKAETVAESVENIDANASGAAADNQTEKDAGPCGDPRTPRLGLVTLGQTNGAESPMVKGDAARTGSRFAMTQQRPTDGLPGDTPFPLEAPVMSVAQTETSAFTVMCAWCGVVQTKGNETISHGICQQCTTRLMQDDGLLR